MKYDQAVQLAREAGLFVPQAGIPEDGALMRFAILVESAERESCAKVCEDLPMHGPDDETADWYGLALIECAAAIRARSKT